MTVVNTSDFTVLAHSWTLYNMWLWWLISATPHFHVVAKKRQPAKRKGDNSMLAFRLFACGVHANKYYPYPKCLMPKVARIKRNVQIITWKFVRRHYPFKMDVLKCSFNLVKLTCLGSGYACVVAVRLIVGRRKVERSRCCRCDGLFRVEIAKKR